MLVDQRAGLHLPAFVVGDAHLALGHTAGGEVEDEGLPAAQGHTNAAGVGAIAAITPTEGRHHGPRQHVHEVQGHQSLRHGHLGKVANASQVVRVGQRQHHRTQLPGHELVLPVAVPLALGGLARGGGQHQPEDALARRIHRLAAVDDAAAVDVDVLFLLQPQRGVGGQLERRATARSRRPSRGRW
jgi:hypothetical protein